MNTRTSNPCVRSDSGAALILTIVWSAVLLLLAGVVSTAVLNQVRPSDRAEKSFEAWSAAEAGVDDMRARLAANGTYWKTVTAYYADPVANAAAATANPALGGWASVTTAGPTAVNAIRPSSPGSSDAPVDAMS